MKIIRKEGCVLKKFFAVLIACLAFAPAAQCWPDSAPMDADAIAGMELIHIPESVAFHPFLNGQAELDSLCLHHVGTGGILSITGDQLQELIMEYSRKGYEFVDADDLARMQNTLEKPKRKMVMFSFDDGYADNYEMAAPILENYGVKGTFFVSTGKLDEPGYLTKEQVADLSDRGFAIGSHTVSHADLSGISMSIVDWELKKSKEDLEKITGKKINAVAYPCGEVNQGVVDTASQYYTIGFLATHSEKTDENPMMVNRWGVFEYNWSIESIKNNSQSEH